MSTSPVQATGLFALLGPQTAQREGLAQGAFANGLELLTDKKYDEAIREFRRALSLAPNASQSVDVANYIGRTYAQQNDSRGAIEAYQQSLRMDPSRADTRIALGNIYYAEKRYQDAQREYEQAVRLDGSAPNRYSLGQAYLATGRYADAEIQFNRVRDLAPGKPNGEFGRGLVFAREGRYSDAIGAFQRALTVKKDYWEAYAEMGYAYADSGQLEVASDVAAILKPKDTTLFALLTAHIRDKTPPKLLATYPGGTFADTSSAGTLVSGLDAYLATADASRTFSVIFLFNHEMDRDSVENVLNWSIGRSGSAAPGQAYNFGLPIPDTEITLAGHPGAVYYDATTLTATIWFEVRQNAGSDGTIDPSHIRFAFSGTDSLGLSMDAAADEYTGFSGVA